MSRPLRKLLQIGLATFLFAFIILQFHVQKQITNSRIFREIPEECKCLSKNSSFAYNFCYQLPESKNVRGKRFDCRFVEKWNEIESTSRANKFLNPKNGTTTTIPDAVFVSAFSGGFVENGLRLIRSIRTRGFHEKIVIYDLGMPKHTRDLLRDEACNVEVRKFDFHKYPKYFRNLREYRWKPIIIAETLAEFGAIWYMDSSVLLAKNNLSHVYNLVACRKTGNSSVDSSAQRDHRESTQPHESGWDFGVWARNVRECDKSAYLLHSFAGHGIYSTTHPRMFDYLPTNFDEIRKRKSKMYEAGLVYAIRTQQTVIDILKWYVLCALEEDCMSPKGSQLFCKFHKSDRYSAYANCHRYDQSAINVILANQYHYDRHFYSSEIVDFFRIRREHTSENNNSTRLLKCI